MAMIADSSHNHQAAAADTINSPQKRTSLPSPWAQVVRAHSDSIPPQQAPPPPQPQPQLEQSPFSDCSSPVKATSPLLPPPLPLQPENSDTRESNNGNAGALKKPAWKKPTPNGLAPVMGDNCWPALSESTNKASPKSSPSPPPDSSTPKIVVDGSPSIPTSQGPVTPNSPQKQVSSNNGKYNSRSNHAMPARQRSMKRGGGGGSSGGSSSSGGVHSQSTYNRPLQTPPSPPPYSISAIPPNGFVNFGNSWEPRPVVGGFIPQPPMVNDHRHSYRRGNFGPRGDGSYHSNFRGRRDQDRGRYGNGRDVPGQPQMSPRGHIRSSLQNTAPFVASQPFGPFANSFPDLVYTPAPFEHYGVPYFPHAPASPVMVAVHEPTLPEMLRHQIEFYFSDGNLVGDEFLKSKMDDQGWVPITVIACFNRIRTMTNDIHLILDSLKTSTVLEVQDEKVRSRNNWMQWVPSSSRLHTDSSSQTFSSSGHDLPTNAFENMTLEENTANQNNMADMLSPNSDDAPMCSSELAAQTQGDRIESASSS